MPIWRTSYSALWNHLEKEERKFCREVEKENDTSDRKTLKKERKGKEKGNIH